MKHNNEKTPAHFTKFSSEDQWVSGSCGNYSFQAKLFDEGSEFGINDGRVSKLSIRHKLTVVVNYDRGWDIEPTDEHKDAYDAIMALLENSPKRF